jgi:hypothetical protein
MEYLILALIVVIFTRYIVPMLDVMRECFDMIIASKVNNINIKIAEKQHTFEKSCEDLEVDVGEEPRVCGFVPPGDTEEFVYEEEDDEDFDDDDNGSEWVNKK